jgi:hypothetical protein
MSSQPLLPRDQENDEDQASGEMRRLFAMTGPLIVSNRTVLKASCCCCCAGTYCIFQMGLMAAYLAFGCFLFLITGHAILRLTDLAVYSDFSIHSSMQVGAAGGAVLFPALLFMSGIEGCLDTEAIRYSAIGSVTLNMVNLVRSTVTGAAAGWVGSKVLSSHGYTVMDPWHAVWAGALGGTVLGPCIIIGTIL